MTTKVYAPGNPDTPLTPNQLAQWANKVHRKAGGKGSPFTKYDYYESLSEASRLGGYLCNCGVNEIGFSKGQFDLLPIESEDVQEGGKAYMVCRICGCISHL